MLKAKYHEHYILEKLKWQQKYSSQVQKNNGEQHVYSNCHRTLEMLCNERIAVNIQSWSAKLQLPK